MADLQIYQFPCRQDNYGVLIHDPDNGRTAAIDAPELGPIERALGETGWQLSDILCTHHHADHTEAIAPLKDAFGCVVYGPRAEAAAIPALDVALGEGDTFDFAGHAVEVLETPGHTLGHIAYVFPGQSLAFAGDALFALGCGRVFEGTMEEMWSSLTKLMALPPDTVVYCGHEYTEANARFAVTIEPGNAALKRRAEEIAERRARGEPTLPTTIGLELETNPFLRVASPEIRQRLGLESATDAAVFAEVRRRKDSF